ncbi:MAG: hypothetical protein SRB2_01096 [Desulfobacteraceae bacterium Eth-SRB2]|nr:MAG: hypothetical protein SRB2_01096 [Desulfobacteraceae bacterium Eth-SRB2]
MYGILDSKSFINEMLYHWATPASTGETGLARPFCDNFIKLFFLGLRQFRRFPRRFFGLKPLNSF